MRTPLVVGNWKMNQNLSLIEEFFKNFQVEDYSSSVQFGLCPVSLHLAKALELKSNSVLIGSQDSHFNESGAHTGDISAVMVKELGGSLAVVGHSERRADHSESSELVTKKAKAAIQAGLIAIVCLGETLEQRQADQTEAVVEKQLRESLTDISIADTENLVIAYEPVWAIGTGVTASPQQAQEVHAVIRKLLVEIYNDDVSQSLRILYGGSVKPDNAQELMSCTDIDGALVGGASIKADSFTDIIKAAVPGQKEENK